MKTYHYALAVVGLFTATSLGGQTSDQVFELEEFITEETANSPQDSLSPLATPVEDSLGFEGRLVELPRAVTQITPETMEAFDLDDFGDLPRYGAGTQRIDYFGLPGAPALRGTKAGLYYNGMLRLYQRNEMPTSFGSTEGLDLVKGPAPAYLSPTLVGGFVNMRPKSPYFDEARGSVEFEVGRWDYYRAQLDYGAPFLLAGKPAAYRVSVSGQRADRYFDNIQNDYESVYGALKIKLSDRTRLFIGGEYYNFRSSEVPGINRPTQALIDNGQYVIGESPDLTSSAWGGTVARPLVVFPYTGYVQQGLHALAIPGEVAREQIDPDLLGTMINLNDPDQVANLYRVRTDEEIAADPAWSWLQFRETYEQERTAAADALATVDVHTQDAYVYTPEYFAAGGEALTQEIDRSNILADPEDTANSRDYLFFAELTHELGPDATLRYQMLTEGLETRKRSTYGYAHNTEQFMVGQRLSLELDLPDWNTDVTTGVAFRGSYAEMRQDFDAEPFSRRDLTADAISDNSVVLAGGKTDPDGNNLWSTFGGASEYSHLYQLAAFAQARTAIIPDRLALNYALRAEQAWFIKGLPADIDYATEADREDKYAKDNTAYLNGSINPTLRLWRDVYLYGAAQLGKAFSPGDGGTLAGKESFTDVELYEGGLKASLLDRKLFVSLAAYHWDQAVISSRDAEARPLRAKGAEFEFNYTLSDRLVLLGSFTAQRVYQKDATAGYGAVVQTEEEYALGGGILQGASDRELTNNPEGVYGGFPELSANFYARYQTEQGWGGAFGPTWRSGYYHDINRELHIPASWVWDASIFYENDDWRINLRVDNVFDEDYWLGQDPVFSAGTLIIPGEPRSWKLSVTRYF
ncbi:MAG: putative TonB-dependent receptor [Puniceicoccaceae bacterium 5H]|nr:MAG: putative TonB-dependent receptor [Puniceicoccaceae bacterium 5H]